MIQRKCILLLALFASVWLTDTDSAFANNYGAIAFSPQNGAFGRSWDYPSRRAAERVAMRNCRKHARDCRVMWFRNACGAVARGNNGGWGTAWANTSRGAQRKAINKCSQYTSGCRIRVWQCTSR